MLGSHGPKPKRALAGLDGHRATEVSLGSVARAAEWSRMKRNERFMPIPGIRRLARHFVRCGFVGR
jgi:hypothetical protein